VYWLVLATLGDALTAIVGCAGLLAGVWLIARTSSAGGGATPAPGAEPAQAAPAPAADEPAPHDPPATTFRHGAIRLAGDPAREDAPAAPQSQRPLAAVPEPQAEPAPFVPPPLPPAPRTPFRQGRIRLGGLERGDGSPGPAGEPPDEPPDAA
jgi:hypothetical protein